MQRVALSGVGLVAEPLGCWRGMAMLSDTFALSSRQMRTDSAGCQAVPSSSHSSTIEGPEVCGRRDSRTRRGRIFRGTYREELPRQGLHPQQFPGGPAFHRPGSHGWRDEPFRYPDSLSPQQQQQQPQPQQQQAPAA
ncbi:hypothetical protein Agub_g9371 [Astrephomene gubernaculifera]|uniref:Uncharacterized protein n=1 Tax=Astrephomene gubernaculifera TaxID=47775 RepID=A0AAD3HNW3_9CHLO|nr:hypothetical protein Agub_g9371 [Astrephomene gubernaculifera]